MCVHKFTVVYWGIAFHIVERETRVFGALQHDYLDPRGVVVKVFGHRREERWLFTFCY